MNVEQTILRHEALEVIDSGQPFDLVFLTADRRRGTGGAIKRVQQWLKIKGDEPTERLPGEMRVAAHHHTAADRSRNPDHYRWKTFNIYNPANPGQHVTKVHWRLMIFLNGKRILQ